MHFMFFFNRDFFRSDLQTVFFFFDIRIFLCDIYIQRFIFLYFNALGLFRYFFMIF